MNENGLTDPRETKPEMGDVGFAAEMTASRYQLLADLLVQTDRVDRDVAWLRRNNDNLHQRSQQLYEDKERLINRVVAAERALADCEEKDNALPAAVYLETLDEDYIARLRSDNAEARSF